MGTMATDLTQPLLAISGATGAVGGRIASRLAGLGHHQRLIVRDAARASDLPGAELTEGTYEDPEAMRRALDGMRTFFMVSAGESSDRVRIHTAAVDAAVEAGVERIVYLSFVGAAPEATSTLAREETSPRKRYTFLYGARALLERKHPLGSAVRGSFLRHARGSPSYTDDFVASEGSITRFRKPGQRPRPGTRQGGRSVAGRARSGVRLPPLRRRGAARSRS